MLRKNLSRAYEIDSELKNIEEQISYIERIEQRSGPDGDKDQRATIIIYGRYDKAFMNFDFAKGKKILLEVINKTKASLEKELAELK